MEEKNRKKLKKELCRAIQGEARFDDGSRALYASDASNYRQIPIGVVIPACKDDIIKTIQICHAYDVPVFSRGGGTSLAGQCCNTAIVLDMSKCYNQVLKIDPDKKIAVVQPGVVHDALTNAAKPYQLTFGPDPSTHAWCTLGGMIGNNSCGSHFVMAGKTDDNVIELEILTYDGIQLRVGPTTERELQELMKKEGRVGEIYTRLHRLIEKYGELIEQKYPKIPRRVSGYNLPWLLKKNGFDVAKALVGSESTCVTILEVTVRLVHNPPHRALVLLGYPDVYSAGDHVMEIMEFKPIALEGLDHVLIDDVKKKYPDNQDFLLLPIGRGWLSVEFGADTQEEANFQAHRMIEVLKRVSNPPSIRFYDDPKTHDKITELREAGLGATARVPDQKDTWEGWEDSAVPPEKLGNYLRDLRRLFQKYDYACALYGHFGQGCVHTRIDFDMYTHEGLKKYRSFIHEAADLVVSYGGSISGEHGDGQSKAELFPKMFGEELMDAFREFKRIWDPKGKMNPGKYIDAYHPTEKIRLGPHYNPPQLKTHFQFPGDDEGSFARATLRCVGIGKCRQTEKGTMCPSYMATREEMHSTRGRTHLLFEMLQGDVVGKKGWKDPSVKEALSLCLSCKSCKTECPMNVDMATYKAEFLSHYYEGRLRPRSAYAFGLIHQWSRLASHFPRLANFFTQTPGLSRLSKWMIGASNQRKIPQFADETLVEWFEKNSSPGQENKVILWPDTFTNFFYPEIGKAAVQVLQKLGFQVALPRTHLCCGRPLYDYGMLASAKKHLISILENLKDDIKNGTPIIGLEPSCVSVFKEEMCNLFPADLNARRLKDHIYILSEFLHLFAKEIPFPPLKKKAIVHGHCHHKSVLKFDAEKEILKKLELDFEILDSGCCGMAGSFGFEKDHYDVSLKVGERILLPRIRETTEDTLIITNGFSCRQQIEQLTGKQPLHLAQVLLMSFQNQSSSILSKNTTLRMTQG
jgi:FAD/FMN-containing dehydrogenase/Fe-S oxidoreductase